MRSHVLALRIPALLVYAALLTGLVAWSSLAALLPAPMTPATLALVGLAFAVACAPALFVSGSPLPAMLALLVPVILVAAYDRSALDWLRTLKEFHVAAPGPADPLRMAYAAVVALYAWALHGADHALRLRRRLEERGVPRGQARLAARAVARRCAMHGGVAAGGVLVLGVLAHFATRIPLPSQRLTFVLPIVAAALVAVGAWLLARHGADAPAR